MSRSNVFLSAYKPKQSVQVPFQGMVEAAGPETGVKQVKPLSVHLCSSGRKISIASQAVRKKGMILGWLAQNNSSCLLRKGHWRTHIWQWEKREQHVKHLPLEEREHFKQPCFGCHLKKHVQEETRIMSFPVCPFILSGNNVSGNKSMAPHLTQLTSQIRLGSLQNKAYGMNPEIKHHSYLFCPVLPFMLMYYLSF